MKVLVTPKDGAGNFKIEPGKLVKIKNGELICLANGRKVERAEVVDLPLTIEDLIIKDWYLFFQGMSIDNESKKELEAEWKKILAYVDKFKVGDIIHAKK